MWKDIAIVVEERAAGSHGFGQVLGAERAAVLMKVDAGRGRHIHQPEAQPVAGSGKQRRRQTCQPAKKRTAVHAMLTSPSRMA